VEQHSGNSSISANIDGTTFYMIVEKLPEAYKAKLNIKGEDFYLRITPNSTLSDNWGNPAVSTYSSAVGEREISFLPGYTTPIVFGFVGDETRQPALYLDGAEMTGTVNNDSGAIEYFVTPYSPESGSAGNAGLQSTIDVYNSFSERPTLSGASLVVEEGAEAEFFYSPVLHEANPAGQVVISGTQFTVKPANRRMIVTYKNEAVKLNANGEFVFNATGNARNNVVKVSPAPPVDPDTYLIYPEDGTTVDNLSSISITFPEVKEVEYNEIPVTLVGPETNLSSIDVHGNANEWTVGFHNPAISGEYTVTFPEGAFTLDGKPSLETKAVYTFKTGWELLPAPGSKVENLDEIILSFPEAKEVQFVGQTYSFTLMQGNSYASPGMNCRKVEGASVPTFSITLVEGAMAPPIGLITF
ncbi:MAG: hypothetical protein K2H76_05560, partial [Muribaculaceae bacterium]|nr:hypothetical protein [Muribaculaceae bacterium]